MNIKFMPFYNVDGEIGTGESLSVESTEIAVDTGTAPVSDDNQAATEDVTKQQSFANRLKEQTEKAIAEERSKWEKETSEKYKDYDVYRKATEYLQKTSGINDVMSLKEQLEMAELQERAEKEQVSPEVIKRLDELEAKAAKADQLEQQQQQQQINSLFWQSAEKFVEGKDISKEDLNQYMVENEIYVDPTNPEAAERKFTLAYKAMRADALEKQLEQAEKEGMKKLIQSKSNIATIPSKAGQGQVIQTPPKTFAEARQRAMQRMNGEG